MKIQLPDRCPVCGAEIEKTCQLYLVYKCGLWIDMWAKLDIKSLAGSRNCADKILVKFGTSESTGYEEKDNEKSK